MSPSPPFRRRSDYDTPESSGPRALVVDDEEGYRAYISAIVRRYGFEVTARADGVQALEALRDGTYDFLLADCEMPRMDGLALIGEVRADARHADMYAVMLTGRQDAETKIAALRFGYDDYLVKSSGELEIAAKLSAGRRLITRQRRLDAQVRELYGLATRDELTGVFNRRFLFAEAERLIEEGVDVSIVFFDLDDFKHVNDTYGHLAGDRILRDLGSLFLRRTRHEDLIARYGGDEFVMLVAGLGPEEIEGLTARMAAEIATSQWTFGTDSINVGVTTGFSCSILLEHPTLQRLLSAGDRDLYKNKWLRHHPNDDPSLYEYDRRRDAEVRAMPGTAAESDEERASDKR